MNEEYVANSAEGRSYELLKNEMVIGELKYKNWTSLHASIHLAGKSSIYTIEPKGFWGTTLEIKENNVVIGSYEMNWKGSIIIDITCNSIKRQFIYKIKSVLKGHYNLMDESGIELLFVKPIINWKKIKYSYYVSTEPSFKDPGFKDLLILTTIHCANYFTGTMAAVI